MKQGQPVYDPDVLRVLHTATGLDWAVIYPDGDRGLAYWLCLTKADREKFTVSSTAVVDEQGVIHETA
jgi:hypothetical protein